MSGRWLLTVMVLTVVGVSVMWCLADGATVTVLSNAEMTAIRGGWGSCSCGGASCPTPNCPKSNCSGVGGSAPYCYNVSQSDRCYQGDCTIKQCRDNITWTKCNAVGNSTCTQSLTADCTALWIPTQGYYLCDGKKVKSCGSGCCGHPQGSGVQCPTACSCLGTAPGSTCYCHLNSWPCNCVGRA